MFILDKGFAEEMIAHAREEVPNEACGLLAGVNGRVTKLYRCSSAEKSPYRYFVDAKEQLQAMREIDEKGWELLGIYHSHTHTEAYPSKTDVELAFYPDALHFIVSLADWEQPVIRAFRIVDEKIIEVKLLMVEMMES
ncbi:MAG: M67 family metallopeptidase [candidate division NC10 bacterium]|nr:M67 family metallopeptidase [candidate division NC10 bacterium]